jgi:hypothetical protein
MARSGDTKLLCHVAQMIIALSGVSLWPLSGGKSLVLCQPGSQETSFACSSRRLHRSPIYLGRAVISGPHIRGEVAVLGRLHMSATKEPHSCLTGVPIAMWHRVSRCVPRTSAGHTLCRTMPVAAHDSRAPARARLDWEAHKPTRRVLQHAPL